MYVIEECKRNVCYLFACLSVRLSSVPICKNIYSLYVYMLIYNLYIQIYLRSDSGVGNQSCIHGF